jgi:tetratricopeptide (TPR) repeat protein
MTRYAAVTELLIDKCQQDYAAGLDLAHSIPSLSGDEVALVVAESLEADDVIHQPREILLEHARTGTLTDWSMAVLAEMLFVWAEDANPQEDIFAATRRDEYEALAWNALEHTITSPTASPTLWYEQIYFEVSRHYLGSNDNRAIDFLQRGLLYDIDFYQARNAINFLRDLAEAHLSLDQLATGLNLFTHILRFQPGDIWTYNAIALSFDRFGLTELGTAATRRGLLLFEQVGEPAELRPQLTSSLEDMRQAARQGRETEVTPPLIDDFRQALELPFDTPPVGGVVDLCRQLLPDFDRIPRKTRKPAPQLPAVVGAAPRSKPGRNDPCWCGSGKKYKNCHLKNDMGRE